MIKLMNNTFYEEEKTKKVLCDYIMENDILSMNKKCDEFEKQYAKWQGLGYCVMFNSGSSANLGLIQSLKNMGKLKEHDYIGVSAITWATNFMPLIQMGLNVIPIDVDRYNLNVNSATLWKRLYDTPLDALFLTNCLGFCADIDNIKDICDMKDILFIEDNCESMGSEYRYKKLGNFGYASTYSTYVGHHMSTIEGGMVCTNDEELNDMLRMVRSHGWNRSLDEKKKKKLRKENNIDDFIDKYTFYELAYNLRPTEIQAVLGLEQLKYIEEIIHKRQNNFLDFNLVAAVNDKIEPLVIDDMNIISNFAYPIISMSTNFRNKFDKQVEIRPIVGGNIQNQPVYNKYKLKNMNFNCPNANYITDFGFYIPNNPELNSEECEIIMDLLSK